MFSKNYFGDIRNGYIKFILKTVYLLLCFRQGHCLECALFTLEAWYSYFQDIAYKVAWHDFHMLGGRDDIIEVEVDETHVKGKYHRERKVKTNNIRFFGGFSRFTGKIFGRIIKDLSSDTLICGQWEFHLHQQMEWCHFAGYECVSNCCNLPQQERDPYWAKPGRFSDACLDSLFIGPCPAVVEVDKDGKEIQERTII